MEIDIAMQEQFCENTYLNEVFSFYFERFQELEAVFRTDIQIGEEKLPYEEVCRILSYGLETVCNDLRIQDTGEREVSVQMKCSRDCLILRIKSRCNDNLTLKNEAVFENQKVECSEEMLAVREIVEKLDGVMLCYEEPDNFALDVLVRF